MAVSVFNGLVIQILGQCSVRYTSKLLYDVLYFYFVSFSPIKLNVNYLFFAYVIVIEKRQSKAIFTFFCDNSILKSK